MLRKCCFFAAVLVMWMNNSHAQWQAVPSPGDRIFAFAQSGTGIFAGSENSGLWKSANGGASFALHPTDLLELGFDVRDFERSHDTLWAATFGGGVCRSVDGGTTWSSFNHGFQTQFFAVGVEQLEDTIYAAVAFLPGMQASGVYKTSVQQANWKRTGTGFSETNAGVNSFAITASGAMFVGAALSGTLASAGWLAVTVCTNRSRE